MPFGLRDPLNMALFLNTPSLRLLDAEFHSRTSFGVFFLFFIICFFVTGIELVVVVLFGPGDNKFSNFISEVWSSLVRDTKGVRLYVSVTKNLTERFFYHPVRYADVQCACRKFSNKNQFFLLIGN